MQSSATQAECEGPAAEFQTRCCQQGQVDPATYKLFLHGKCLDHTRPLSELLSDETDGTEVLTLVLAQGSLRVRFVHNTVEPVRLYLDLRPDRTVADLLEEIRQGRGFTVTPTILVCKGVEVDPSLTLAASVIELDDVVTVVRNCSSVAVAPCQASNVTTVRGVFYDKPFCVTLPSTWTIRQCKEVLAQRFLEAADLGGANADFMGAPLVSQLRVVQLNVKFKDTATLAELKPVTIEVLRQWDPEHLESSNFHKNGWLRFNCPYCAKGGAVAQLRPHCASCRTEGLICRLTPLDRWSDLIGSKGQCHACKTEGSILWGFFCTAKCCGSRCSTHRTRSMISLYDSSKSADALLKAINSVFSHASVAGRVDTSEVDHYVAVRAPRRPVALDPLRSELADLTGAANWQEMLDAAVNGEGGGDTADGGGAATSSTSNSTTEEDTSAPTNAGTSVVELGRVSQQTMLAQGLHLPDTFFTTEPIASANESGEVATIQWIGLPEGYTLVLAGNDPAQDTMGGPMVSVPALSGDCPRYCVVRVTEQREAGGGGGGSWWTTVTRVAQSVASFTIKLGPVQYSPAFGFAPVAKDAFVKGMRRVRIEVLRPVSVRAHLALGGNSMDDLRDETAMQEFQQGLAAVDDKYRAHTDVEESDASDES